MYRVSGRRMGTGSVDHVSLKATSLMYRLVIMWMGA